MATFTVSQGVDLLKSKRFSDFVIRCDGHDFAVHKSIIYQESQYFALCIDSPFKEAKESAINIQEANPLAVACVVLWIYTGASDLKMATEVWPTLSKPLDEIKGKEVFESLTLNVLVYELAQRLLLPDLQVFISEQLIKHLEDMRLFYFYSIKVATEFLSDVYTHTVQHDDVFRASVTAYCVHNHNDFDDWYKPEVMEVINKHEKKGWKIGMAIQAKLEKAEEEHQKLVDETWMKARSTMFDHVL